MIPKRYAPLLFTLFLSGQMSFIVSGVATLRAIGFTDSFVQTWLAAWSLSWPVAFCVGLVARHSAQWMTNALTR